MDLALMLGIIEILCFSIIPTDAEMSESLVCILNGIKTEFLNTFGRQQFSISREHLSEDDCY